MVRSFPAMALLFMLPLAGCAASPNPLDAGESLPRYASPVVLFVGPDEHKLEQLRRDYGEDFYTVADDAMWYRSEAYDLLDAAGVPYAHPETMEAWFEVGGTPGRFSWSDVDRAWFLVFYDGIGEPGVFYDNELPSALEAMGSDRLP